MDTILSVIGFAIFAIVASGIGLFLFAIVAGGTVLLYRLRWLILFGLLCFCLFAALAAAGFIFVITH